MKHKESLLVGARVRLAGSGLKGIIISRKANYSAFSIKWSNGRVGHCQASDLELIDKRRAA